MLREKKQKGVASKLSLLLKEQAEEIMGDEEKKVHPAVNVKVSPTAPLVPRGSAMSEKGITSNSGQQQWQQQAAPLVPRGSAMSEKGITSNSGQQQQQQQQPAIPVMHSLNAPAIPAMHSLNPPKKVGKCSCCKCICYTISILVLLLTIIAAIVGILYLVFQPKLPKYSVDSLRISDLRLNIDLSLYAKFDVKITANNPNKKIGIYYENGGKLSVWYTKTKLCEGSLPKFYQGHQNITKLDVALTGQSQYGNTLMNALQEQQQTGQIPLDLKVDAPVAIKLGKLKLKKIRILGECLLVVDSLTANNVISIKASNCRFKSKP